MQTIFNSGGGSGFQLTLFRWEVILSITVSEVVVVVGYLTD